jgi:thiamine kinase-like enzyme
VVEASGRPGYEQAPRQLREWVERELGSRVASATSQPGGFSPGVAASRVRTSWWTQAAQDRLPSWVRAHRRQLIALEERVPVAVRGHTLCHRDVLAENILLAQAGDVVFVGWAWACQGAAWIDTMNLVCGVAMDRAGIDVDALISASPRTREVEPEILTAYLANSAGSAYVKAQQSGLQNIPALQAFRQRRATALLDWLQHRTGW